MEDPKIELLNMMTEPLLDKVIERPSLTAMDMQHRYEIRQKYSYENIADMFM